MRLVHALGHLDMEQLSTTYYILTYLSYQGWIQISVDLQQSLVYFIVISLRFE